KVDDLVLGPATRASGPLLLGLVAVVNRNRIFVSASRIGELGGAGVRLRTSAVDLRGFRLRKGEMLTSSLFDQRVDGGIAVDFALEPCAAHPGSWEIATVALTHPGPLRRRRSVHTVPWFEAADLFDAGDVAEEVATLRAMHPSDIAKQMSSMPHDRKHA